MIQPMRMNYMSIREIEIKKALLDARVKQIDIARKLRISRQYVNVVIKGRRNTARVRRAIARAAGKRVRDLWPSRSFKKAA